MKKLVFISLLATIVVNAQSYPPAAGQLGSTAIAADNQSFISWATGISVVRGHVDLSNPDFEASGSSFATYGEPENALGLANSTAVSLGDAGEAILTFDRPIKDGPGFDFAVFENSFSDTYLELAFVEVSSDGTNYFRFPSHSQTQTIVQVEGFGNIDPTYINNLAGKYRAMFGTPFDISELEDNPLLNKNKITHIKILDVVGSIDSEYARYDSFGNAINDPFPTPFYSSGFDLDAVGVINEQVLGGVKNQNFEVSIYPNPVSNILFIEVNGAAQITGYDLQGRMIISEMFKDKTKVDVSVLQSGTYIITISSGENSEQYRFVKQ
ncbi:T9SS type A sorting domain-containing protein [Aequorivita capsosiphonis]|uniref:T9SS type A sorting domain-containing protein n=1 Tax=Aequorivita capsosiphonis TaxID=487317 RepID=UPI0003FFBFB0|nr:T9SS type A sorting domain-containing protein [Aequorivita capsosiphonis]